MATEIHGHEYEPGDIKHPMHTDPLCQVCGTPKQWHDAEQ